MKPYYITKKHDIHKTMLLFLRLREFKTEWLMGRLFATSFKYKFVAKTVSYFIKDSKVRQ